MKLFQQNLDEQVDGESLFEERHAPGKGLVAQVDSIGDGELGHSSFVYANTMASTSNLQAQDIKLCDAQWSVELLVSTQWMRREASFLDQETITNLGRTPPVHVDCGGSFTIKTPSSAYLDED